MMSFIILSFKKYPHNRQLGVQGYKRKRFLEKKSLSLLSYDDVELGIKHLINTSCPYHA